MKTALNSDPLSWAARVGAIDLEAIDPTLAPEEFNQQLARRGAQARAVGAYYGVDAKYFTDEERARVASVLDEGGDDQRLAVIRGVVDGFGADAQNALSEISDQAPVYAHLGGLLASGAPLGDVRAGLAGLRAREEKVGVELRAADVAARMDDYLGNALDERFAPVRAQIKATAEAIYTSEMLRRGSTVWNSSVFDNALARAVGARADGGGVSSRNGHSLLLPARVNEDQFETLIDGLSDDDLKARSAGGGQPVHGDGSVVKADEVRDGYLVTVGSGLYQVSMTDPTRRREFLLDGNTGGLFVLDLNDGADAPEGAE